MLDSKLAAPQGFEPRYADPEARDFWFSGIPAVLLNCQEIPFFSMRYWCQSNADDIADKHTTIAEKRSKRKKCYRFLLPVRFFRELVFTHNLLWLLSPIAQRACIFDARSSRPICCQFATCLTESQMFQVFLMPR